jgi:hypothetical protein
MAKLRGRGRSVSGASLRRAVSATTMVAVAHSAGCYSTWDIAPREINRLDGYRSPVAKVTVDKAGDRVEVDHDTQLSFVSNEDFYQSSVPSTGACRKNFDCPANLVCRAAKCVSLSSSVADAETARLAFRGSFDSIDIHIAPPTAFAGSPPKAWWLTGILRDDGTAIRVDLNKVVSVTARRFSPGKTAGLIVGCVVGAAVIAGAMVGIISAVSIAKSGPD